MILYYYAGMKFFLLLVDFNVVIRKGQQIKTTVALASTVIPLVHCAQFAGESALDGDMMFTTT
jgi:hypothetical protein